MSKSRIAGLTVEIGGETSALSKSLSSVNKDLSNTQKSLTDVDKLLKFDTSNTTLLAQKQQYLAQQINTTKEKLESLYLAEQQAKSQLSAGAINQTQYDALQREIVATENSLKKFETSAKETAQTVDSLGKENTEAADDTKELGDKSKATAKETDKLGDDSKDASKGVGDLGDESGQAGTKLTAAAVAAKVASTAMAGLKTVASGMGNALSAAVSKTAEMMANMAKAITAGLAVASAAVIKLSVDFAKTAAEIKAENSQFEQTFGDMGDTASAAIDRVADSSGILDTRLKSTATSIYAFAKASGGDATEAMDLMERGLQVAADSAAYYDKSLEETSETLKSFLKGNFANDAALGVSATEFTRNAAAIKLYGKEFKDLSEIEKQFTLLNMVEEANGLSGALGQAARESDGLENVLGNMKEAWRQTQAELGEPILEAAVPIMQNIVSLIPKITNSLKPLTQGIASVLNLIGSGDFKGLRDFLRGDSILAGITGITSGIGEMINQFLIAAPQFLDIAVLYMETFISGIITSLSAIPVENISNTLMSVFMLAATYISGFLEVGTVIVTKLAEGIASATPGIVNTAAGLILKFIEGVNASLPTLLTAAGQIVASLLQGIIDNGAQLMTAAVDLIGNLVIGIGEQLPTLIPLALEAVIVLISGLLSAESIGKMFDAAISLIKGLVEGLVNSLPMLLEKGPELLGGLVQGILENIFKMRETGFELIGTLIKGILENIPEIISAGIRMIGELAGGFIRALPEIMNSLQSISDSIFDTLESIDLLQIGKDIIQGLINGIKSMVGSVGNAIGEVGNNIVGGLKDFLGIHSPSRVMRDQVGKWIPAGVAKGIEDNMSGLELAANNMAANVMLDATVTSGKQSTPKESTSSSVLNIDNLEIVTQSTDAKGIGENIIDSLQEAMDRKKAVFA